MPDATNENNKQWPHEEIQDGLWKILMSGMRSHGQVEISSTSYTRYGG